MKITKVTIELREAVLATDYVEESAASTKVDFNKLGLEEQIAEIRKSGKIRVSNLLKSAYRPHDLVIKEALRKNPKAIDHLAQPKAHHVHMVVEHHPAALNKLKPMKRTEDLVVKAIRPPHKVMHGSRRGIAQHTLKNIELLESNTPFTSRVHHEIFKLMSGAHPRDLNKLDMVFKKQKRKMPDILQKMIKQLDARKNNNINITKW